jgi:hypothetical protein
MFLSVLLEEGIIRLVFESRNYLYMARNGGRMDETEKVEFRIEVSAIDATEEDVDHMTRQLLFELRETDIESAELARGEAAPRGTKSADLAAIGQIVISVLPTVLPTVVSLVQAWAARGQGRTVKFKGKGIEFEGSPEELHKLLSSLEKQNKKK